MVSTSVRSKFSKPTKKKHSLIPALDIFSLRQGTFTIGGIHKSVPVGLADYESESLHFLLLFLFFQIGPPNLQQTIMSIIVVYCV